jgi:hypothetical protein
MLKKITFLIFSALFLNVFAIEPDNCAWDANVKIVNVFAGDYNDPNGQGILFIQTLDNSYRIYKFNLGPEYVNLAFSIAQTALINRRYVNILRGPLSNNECNGYRILLTQNSY